MPLSPDARRKLVDYGSALGLLVFGAIGATGVHWQVALAETRTSEQAADAVRRAMADAVHAEMAPLQFTVGRLVRVTEDLAYRVGRNEGAIAGLPSPATRGAR
jgi:mannose/fructose/N-acetylgalactosamine-specific phosphotransferase system component IID